MLFSVVEVFDFFVKIVCGCVSVVDVDEFLINFVEVVVELYYGVDDVFVGCCFYDDIGMIVEEVEFGVNCR